MGYVYDFDIASIPFFLLTIVFYLTKKRLRNLQDSIFTAMLFFALTAIIFDFAAVAMEGAAMRFPKWMLYAANMLFMFGMQSCLPLFFLYSTVSAGLWGRFTGRLRLISAVPYAVTMLLLFLSPLSHIGIFFIDEGHIYQFGATHWMLYVNMGVYVVAGVAVILRNGRSIQPVKRTVILLFVVVLFTAMVLQLIFPRYMLMPSATALSLTAVFYALQSPIDQINPLTGAFSRTLMPSLLSDYVGRGKKYTILLLSLRSVDDFVRLHGDDAGYSLLRAYAEKLIARFPSDIVIYMDTSEFTVVKEGCLSREEAESLGADIPDTVELPGFGLVDVGVLLGAVPYEEGEATTEALNTVDFMLREMRSAEGEPFLYGDRKYRSASITQLGLEASIGELLREGRAELLCSAILTRDGIPVIEEARLGAPGETALYVSPAKFMEAAGQGGYATDYYRALMTKLAERGYASAVGSKLCLPLLPAALMRDNGPEELKNVVTELGFSPENIIFSVGESEIASSKSRLAENIRALAAMGFGFMVDDFAEGYTDMSLLISLPLGYARLHESLVDSSGDGGEGAKLLRGLVGVLTDVGIVAVCPWIEGEKNAVLSAGEVLLQKHRAGEEHS